MLDNKNSVNLRKLGRYIHKLFIYFLVLNKVIQQCKIIIKGRKSGVGTLQAALTAIYNK